MSKPVRVLVIVLIAAVVMCGAVLTIHHSVPSSSENDVLTKKMQTAVLNLSQSLYEYTWVLAGGIVNAAADLSGIPADDPASIDILTDLYVENPGVSFMFRTDANGSVVCSFPLTDVAGYGIPSSVLDLGDVSTDLYMRTFTSTAGTEITCLLSPVFSAEGEYEGAVGAAGDARRFFAVPIDRFRNTTGYDVWIVNDQGKILYSLVPVTRETNIFAMAESAGDAELTNVFRMIMSEKEGTITYSAYNYGRLQIVERIAVWNRINTKDNGEITIIVTTDTSSRKLVPSPTASSNLTLEEHVRAAHLYAVENGRDAALAEFSNPKGQFTTQEFYISAWDMNGTMLAHPYRPGLIGHDRSGYEDVNGVSTISMFASRALHGGGYVLMLYPNYLKDMENEVRLVYVQPIDDTWYIAGGVFLSEMPKNLDPADTDAMVRDLRSIVQYAHEYGKEAAIAALDDPSGPYSSEERRIVALDYNGTVLSWSSDPTRVGVNILGVTDVYGASFVRDLARTAKEGGGFEYVYLPIQPESISRLQLQYTLPVDDEWFVSAGVPLY
ncbi:MAG: cache domain-containing protein [Methanocorpusculum sp.]|nr:cache domain-containing protein [Methanocorpusculum sp.]MDE2521767.1 cache domain-containing protein [Methanocorpusculum sp.]MDE2523984.1 cache domain-containing protein [Methanocorpusculum sp.]